MKIGLQLYTVRDELEKDFIGTLEKIAGMGYEGVEFAGYGGLSPEQLKSELDRLQLQALGSHVSLESILEDTQKQIDIVKELGCNYLVVPWVGDEWRYSDENWNKLFDKLGELGQQCKAAGISLCYHNHTFELEECMGGKPVLDAMADSIAEEALLLEIDACWIHDAGLNPVEYIRKYQGRVPLVHFKDLKKQDGHPLTVELGTGSMDLLGVAKAAKDAGTKWLVVEQDECQNPSLISVQRNFNWVKENLSL